MDLTIKLIFALLFSTFVFSASGERRWDDETLDEGDLKPRQKQTRLNVNFRRPGKKPRVRVRGPPLSLPLPSLGSSKYIASPFLSDSPYMLPRSYLPIPRRGLKKISPEFSAPMKGLPIDLPPMKGFPADMTNLGILKGFSPEYAGLAYRDLPYLNPLKKPMGQPSIKSYNRAPSLYLPVTQQQLLLAQLIASSMAENKIKPKDFLSAYQSPHEDSGSSQHVYPLKSKESSKIPSYKESSSTQSSYYPTPSYPSPFTYQEIPQYQEYPSPYEREAQFDREPPSESPYDYSASSHSYIYDSPYPNHESYADEYVRQYDGNSEYVESSIRRQDQELLANHKN